MRARGGLRLNFELDALLLNGLLILLRRQSSGIEGVEWGGSHSGFVHGGMMGGIWR